MKGKKKDEKVSKELYQRLMESSCSKASAAENLIGGGSGALLACLEIMCCSRENVVANTVRHRAHVVSVFTTARVRFGLG